MNKTYMIIPEKLDYIKSCCVAIGLTKPYKTEPSEVFGSGFIINSEYMIFSAWHVLDKCYKKYIQIKWWQQYSKKWYTICCILCNSRRFYHADTINSNLQNSTSDSRLTRWISKRGM